MYYKDLPEDIKEKFISSKLRIIQFSIVNRKNIGEYEEEKVKKEIFKRYNSGIMPLKKEEIERAEYISDELTNKLYKKFETDLEFLDKCKDILLLKRERKKLERDKINILICKYKTLMILSKVPTIYVYKKNNNVFEVIDGQQRILSMLAFLGKNYLDIEDKKINSIKHKFRLKNLKILSECNKKI